jgi:hypothetical protein
MPLGKFFAIFAKKNELPHRISFLQKVQKLILKTPAEISKIFLIKKISATVLISNG